MPETAPTIINLPGLEQTELQTIAGDVTIIQAESRLTIPQLILEGEEDAFEHEYSAGRLQVNENGNNSISISNVSRGGVNIRGGSFSNVVISGGSSIIIGGVDVTNSIVIQGGNPQPRRLKLLLPADQIASHDVGTVSGDVEIEAISSRRLIVGTTSGDIAVRKVLADTGDIRTISGDVDLEDSRFTNPVRIKTTSGDISVDRSHAPSWLAKTISGDIRGSANTGEWDTKTVSGKTKLRP